MQPSTAALWDDFGGRLQGFIRRRVPEPEVDDVLQDAFMRIHRSLARGTVPRDPAAWVYQIARTTVIDHYRSSGADRTSSVDPADLPSLPTRLDEQSARAELARCVQPLLQTLDEPYRQALIWTAIEGISQVEASKRAGISVSGMKSRVQRGRKLLAAKLLRCCEVSFDVRGAPLATHVKCESC